MRATLLLARHELMSLLRSPLGWCTLSLGTAVIGLFFFIVLLWDFMSNQALLKSAQSSFGITAYVVAPTFKSAALLLLLMTPLLSMRSFAEERRRATMPLLLSAPIRMRSLALGKFLGLTAFLWLAVALLTLMSLSLALGGRLDYGLLASCALATLLLASALAAIGVMVSSHCQTPATSAIATLTLLVALWMADGGAREGKMIANEVIDYIAVKPHLDAMLRGAFSSADVIYFLLIIVVCLAVTTVQLDKLRGGE